MRKIIIIGGRGNGTVLASTIEDLNRTKAILKYKVQNQDKIFIPKKIDYIEIIGAIKFPGRYQFEEKTTIGDYVIEAGGKTKNSTNNIYIIDNTSNQKIKASKNKILNSGDVLFIEQKDDYSPFTRFKDIMMILGQAAALYAVINNTSN